MQEKRHALLIGNQAYPKSSGFARLNSPHADVHALQTVLEHPELGGFHDVTTLLDKTRTETEKAIQAALRSKAKDDVLLIYYSGHGKTDDSQNLYLATPDTEVDYLEVTAIDAAKVSRMMGTTHAENTILVLDCCHAGAFPTGFKSGDAMQNMADNFARSGGTYVLMACDAYDLASDGGKGELSLMTKHIVEGLNGAADRDGDGLVTVNELTTYLDEVMARGDGQKFNTGGANQRGDIRLVGQERPMVERILQDATLTLRTWSDARSISSEDEIEILTYFKQVRDTAPTPDDPRWKLVQRMTDASASSGDFISAWIRLERAPEPTATAPINAKPKAPRKKVSSPPVKPAEPAKPKRSAKTQTKPNPKLKTATPPERAKHPKTQEFAEPAAVFTSPKSANDSQPSQSAASNSSNEVFEFILDLIFVDNEWIGFLVALAVLSVVGAGVPILLYMSFPDVFFFNTGNFFPVAPAVFGGIILLLSTGWTLAHGESEVKDGFELFIPFVIRIVLLASISYGLLTIMSSEVADLVRFFNHNL
ncbi:MAG: caspase family protein [Aliishimia sp.]